MGRLAMPAKLLPTKSIKLAVAFGAHSLSAVR